MGKQKAIQELRLPAPRFRPKPGKNNTRTDTPPPGKSPRPPEQTFQEAKYLKQLIEAGTEVRVKMADGEEVIGTIEYYDQSFIRLTRNGQPNLFIFKHDIKYIQEEP
jgi:host factor-I protein